MDYLNIAIEAAKLAGRIHKKYFQSRLKIKTKSSSFDLVTIADTDSEKAVTSFIKRHFPRHNFLAEENIYRKTSSEFTWIIDPLDGTNNFASGLPIFCVSIALSRDEEIIAAVVYDVTRDELFYAQKDKGAFLNGKHISVSNIDSLNRALLITGFYYSRGKEMLQTLDAMRRFLLKRIVGLRRLGAAALDLCYIASGRASGFWEFELSPWDFAAGKLIIEEAGGKITNNKAQPVFPVQKSFVVASNGKIHSRMLEVINEAYFP